MSKILGAAEEWGHIAENVAQKTKLPRRQRGTERIVLTPIQVRDIAAVLNEPARHSTPDITREIYLHAIPEDERLVFGPKWTQIQAPTQTASGRVN